MGLKHRLKRLKGSYPTCEGALAVFMTTIESKETDESNVRNALLVWPGGASLNVEREPCQSNDSFMDRVRALKRLSYDDAEMGV